MNHLLLALGICIVLSACVSEKSRMDRWIGHSKDDLPFKWGLQERAVRGADGGEDLVYAREAMSLKLRHLASRNLLRAPTLRVIKTGYFI